MRNNGSRIHNFTSGISPSIQVWCGEQITVGQRLNCNIYIYGYDHSWHNLAHALCMGYVDCYPTSSTTNTPPQDRYATCILSGETTPMGS